MCTIAEIPLNGVQHEPECSRDDSLVKRHIFSNLPTEMFFLSGEISTFLHYEVFIPIF